MKQQQEAEEVEMWNIAVNLTQALLILEEMEIIISFDTTGHLVANQLVIMLTKMTILTIYHEDLRDGYLKDKIMNYEKATNFEDQKIQMTIER